VTAAACGHTIDERRASARRGSALGVLCVTMALERAAGLSRNRQLPRSFRVGSHCALCVESWIAIRKGGSRLSTVAYLLEEAVAEKVDLADAELL
jgi:hypothetical protein